MAAKKKNEFHCELQYDRGVLTVHINRAKNELPAPVMQMLTLCNVQWLVNSNGFNIEKYSTVEYNGVEVRACDFFYTKFRKWCGYHAQLDDLDLVSQVTVVGDEIVISWRKDDLENLLAVTGYESGSKLRNYLLETGWKANLGKLIADVDVSYFRQIQELGLAKALPVTQKFLEIAVHISEFQQTRKKLRSDFAEALPVFLSKWKGRPPMQHQLDYLNEVAKAGDLQCNFDMGLGKTYTSLLQASVYKSIVKDLKIIVLTKASIIDQWYSENGEFLLPIDVHSWAKIPLPSHDNYIVIADESHFTQSMKTDRTWSYLHLCRKALAVINLTGTPFKNGRIKDAQASLMAMGVWKHAVYQDWTFKECYGKYFYYRHKDECLDLPDKVRVEHSVEFSKADKSAVADAYTQFMELYFKRAEAGQVSAAAAHLVALAALRRLLAVGKTQYALELVEELAQQEQVVVFCDFVEPLKELHKKLHNSVYMEASDSSSVRFEKQQAFQRGDYKVFLCSYKCGGVGINLTPATAMVCIDRPYTPADVVQAEDRIHRIGQRNSATIYWLYYYDESGIEKKVEDILSTKQENINYLLDYTVELC